MTIIKKVRLEYSNPEKNSNKFYEVWIEDWSGTRELAYQVWTRSGKIGTSGVKLKYGDYLLPSTSIIDLYKIKLEKENKGYREVSPQIDRGMGKIVPNKPLNRFVRIVNEGK